jgi:hypothetical protein
VWVSLLIHNDRDADYCLLGSGSPIALGMDVRRAYLARGSIRVVAVESLASYSRGDPLHQMRLYS